MIKTLSLTSMLGAALVAAAHADTLIAAAIATPEPMSAVLIGGGLVAIALIGRRKLNKEQSSDNETRSAD